MGSRFGFKLKSIVGGTNSQGAALTLRLSTNHPAGSAVPKGLLYSKMN